VIKTVPSVQLAESEMYDEYVYVKQYASAERVSEWTANETSPASAKIIFLSQIYLSWQFLVCLPGNNAAIERVFSVMSSAWTSHKTRLVWTLKAI
jgi:hypothetical protein